MSPIVFSIISFACASRTSQALLPSICCSILPAVPRYVKRLEQWTRGHTPCFEALICHCCSILASTLMTALTASDSTESACFAMAVSKDPAESVHLLPSSYEDLGHSATDRELTEKLYSGVFQGTGEDAPRWQILVNLKHLGSMQTAHTCNRSLPCFPCFPHPCRGHCRPVRGLHEKLHSSSTVQLLKSSNTRAIQRIPSFGPVSPASLERSWHGITHRGSRSPSSSSEHRNREEALSAACGITMIHLDIVIICSSRKMDSDLTAFTWLHAMMMLSWLQQNTEPPLDARGTGNVRASIRSTGGGTGKSLDPISHVSPCME